MSASVARRDLVLLTFAAASWGVGTVASKRALEEIPPLVLLPVQLGASVLVLVVLMRRSGLALRGSPAILGRLGVLNPGLAYALGLIGLTYISASLSVLLWALEPLMILLLAGVFLNEGTTARLVVLSLTAAAGMALVVYEPANTGQLIGVVISLAGIGCCAAYTVIARRWVSTSDSTAQVVLAQQAYALIFAGTLAIGGALLGAAVLPRAMTPTGLFSAVASGLLYYASAYWFYLSALRTVPASLAATSFYLIPVFGVAASYGFLGDRLDTSQWVGVVIVVAALGLLIRRPIVAGPQRATERIQAMEDGA